MSDFLPTFFSIIGVMALVYLISRRFKISSRYDRKPKVENPWSALDQGIDPTKDSGDR
jgi:hypothetical protein